jgi:hypothetical protein
MTRRYHFMGHWCLEASLNTCGAKVPTLRPKVRLPASPATRPVGARHLLRGVKSRLLLPPDGRAMVRQGVDSG